MNKNAGLIIGIVAVVVGGGALAWFLLRNRAPVAGVMPAAPASSSPGDTTGLPGTATGPSGPSPTQVAGLIAETGLGVAGLITATPAITATAAAGATGAAVGGSTTAGSVAATQAATAAASADTAAGASVAGSTGGGSSGLGAFFTNPWTIGIGAAIAIGVWVFNARRNETKDDRVDFAESIGFYDEVPTITGTRRVGNLDKLFNAMRDYGTQTGTLDVAGELIDRALNVIGKHDTDANVRWMHDVLRFFRVEDTPSVAAGLPYAAPIEDEQPKDVGDGVYAMEA